MCLCRIDYDAKIPESVVTDKVFRQDSSGKLFPAFGGVRGIPETEIPIWQWISGNSGIIRGKRSLSYSKGFHASIEGYAEVLKTWKDKREREKYQEKKTKQLNDLQDRWDNYILRNHSFVPDGTLHWYNPSASPLDVTVQPSGNNFVIRRVKLRSIHTVGRQRFANSRYRTWVAQEMFVYPEGMETRVSGAEVHLR